LSCNSFALAIPTADGKVAEKSRTEVIKLARIFFRYFHRVSRFLMSNTHRI
jgi:hypothetical protein